MHSITHDSGKTTAGKGKRWGKNHKDGRNWPAYNEELVIRGTFLFDVDFARSWDADLREMNRGKRGSPYLFPDSFMKFLMIWKQFLDYRALEGMARYFVNMGIIPHYGDYTTIWYRIHAMRPSLNISGLKYADLASDGTGMKTNNTGSYRIMKYGDPNARKRKHLVVIITADVRTKKIIGIESHVEGKGPSEPEAAAKHLREAVMNGVNVREFYGDGAYDINDLFDLLHSIGSRSVVKIRKNASTGRQRGSKYRRKEIREYRKKGYRQWAEENH